jgi:hypothetical protein
MTSGASEPGNLERVTEQDVEAITEKLKSWITTLPEQEQLVMGWILSRAAAAQDPDIAGYTTEVGAGVPISTLMAQAAGLQDATGKQEPLRAIGPVKIWKYRW